MAKVPSSRLRNVAFLKATAKPDEPSLLTRAEQRSVADELLFARRVIGLAQAYITADDADPGTEDEAETAADATDAAIEALRNALGEWKAGR